MADGCGSLNASPQRTPEERLATLRHTMQGAEVPVVLFAWMEAVELQLAALRLQVNETAATANAARLIGPRIIG